MKVDESLKFEVDFFFKNDLKIHLMKLESKQLNWSTFTIKELKEEKIVFFLVFFLLYNFTIGHNIDRY